MHLIAPESERPNLSILRAQIKDLRETREEFTIQALPWDQAMSKVLSNEFPELVGKANDGISWDGLWDGFPPPSSIIEETGACREGGTSPVQEEPEISDLPSTAEHPEESRISVRREDLEDLQQRLSEAYDIITTLLEETP